MESATWCRTPAVASAGRRLRPEVSKNSSTALSSNEGELARSITTCAPATAALRPSPVMVLTPVRHLRARPIGAIKGDRKILVVLRPVARDAGTDRVKDFYRQPLGIGLRLQHERRRRGNESHFLHALATMPADVARSPVEWPTKMASLRSSASITAARS